MNELAVEMLVALVVWIYRDGGVAEHRLGSRRGDHEKVVGADHPITDVVEAALRLFVNNFEIGDSRLAARAPVHDVLAAIDQAVFIERDEDLAHRAREARIEREALARPVARGPQAQHLLLDGVAALSLPFPDLLFECLPAHATAIELLLGELALDYHLRGDPSVIGAGQPE